jgi:hypothetical protein
MNPQPNALKILRDKIPAFNGCAKEDCKNSISSDLRSERKGLLMVAAGPIAKVV